jgi:hypothetical protein
LGEIGLFCVYSDYAEQTNFGELGKFFLNFSNLISPVDQLPPSRVAMPMCSTTCIR